jgi:hypothetical protein
LLTYGYLAWALLSGVGAAAVLVTLRHSSVHTALRWTWQPLTVAGSTLEWQLAGWNWLASLLILLLMAAILLLEETGKYTACARGEAPSRSPAPVRRRGGDMAHTLWLAAAGLVFVCSTNVLTLATGAILLDTALAMRLSPGLSREPAGRVWGLLTITGWVLLGVLVLLGEDGLRAPLAGRQFTALELALLWLIAMIRAGVYPLHFWLTGPGQPADHERIALYLIGPTTGLWLLGLVHEAAGPQWLHRPEWAALGALALLGTALIAWVADDERARWRWIVLNRISLVVMAAYVAEAAGPPVLVWPLVTFSLGGTLLAVGQVIRARWGWRLPAWVAGLVVWGVPGTPGFLARLALILPTDLAAALSVFVIILVAETLLVAALWQISVGSPATAEDDGPAVTSPPAAVTVVRLSLALGLLAVPVIAWGWKPAGLAALTGLPTDPAFPELPWLLTHARRSVWTGLLFSGAAGVGLGLLRERVFGQMRGWQQGITAIVSLEWLYRAVAAGLTLVGSGLQYFATLGEGEGYLGWLALAVLVVWVLLRG